MEYIAPKQGEGLWREGGRGRQANESSDGQTCKPLALRCWRRADEGASGANSIAPSLMLHDPRYCPAFQFGCNLEKGRHDGQRASVVVNSWWSGEQCCRAQLGVFRH